MKPKKRKNKPGAGRPRLPDAERGRQIYTVLPGWAAERLTVRALAAGVNLSALMRTILVREVADDGAANTQGGPVPETPDAL